MVLVGHAIGALERLDLVGTIAALMRDFGEEDPTLDADAALEDGPEAAADDVPGTPASQFSSDGGKQPEAFLSPVRADQIPQGLFAEGQGLLRQLGDLRQGLQGTVRVAAAQFDRSEEH